MLLLWFFRGSQFTPSLKKEEKEKKEKEKIPRCTFLKILLEYPTILILTLILTLIPNPNLNHNPYPNLSP